MTDKIVVFSTCDSPEQAERLARSLVEARLAACVNVIPQVRSYYRWNGEVQSSAEYMLMIKTSRNLFEQLRLKLESVHSYELPEILALPVVAGSSNFLAWLDTELTGDARG